MLLRITSTLLSCTLLGCLSYARAELKVATPNVDFGIINISKGLVALSWTITNDDKNSLRIMRIDTSYPCTQTSLETGVLAPGASTRVFATFNPNNAVGPINGAIKVIAEHGPVVNLSFTGEVEINIETGTLKTTMSDIGNETTVTASKALTFVAKSDMPFASADISITGEPYIGAHITVDNNKLELIPYIHVPSLPNRQSGHTILKIHFQYAIGQLTYDIPIIWERKDPLHITKLAPNTYAISYDDKYKFEVRSLTVSPGLSYTTQFSNDGLTLLLQPKTTEVAKLKSSCHSITGKRQATLHRVNDKLKTRAVQTIPKIETSTKTILKSRTHPSHCYATLNTNIGSCNKRGAKSKHRTNIKLRKNSLHSGLNNNPQNNSYKSINNSHEVLIQIKTTHPYRSEVIIREDTVASK